MVIKMGKFAQSDMDVGEQQSEIVEDKYLSLIHISEPTRQP